MDNITKATCDMPNVHIHNHELDPVLYQFLKYFDAGQTEPTVYWVTPRGAGEPQNTAAGTYVNVIIQGELVGRMRVVRAATTEKNSFPHISEVSTTFSSHNSMPRAFCVQPYTNRLYKDRTPRFATQHEATTTIFSAEEGWETAYRLCKKHLVLPTTLDVAQHIGTFTSRLASDVLRNLLDDAGGRANGIWEKLKSTYFAQHTPLVHTMISMGYATTSVASSVKLLEVLGLLAQEESSGNAAEMVDALKRMFSAADDLTDPALYAWEKFTQAVAYLPGSADRFPIDVFPYYDCYTVEELLDNQVRVTHLNELEEFTKAVNMYGTTSANPYNNGGKHHPTSKLSSNLTFFQYYDNMTKLPEHLLESVSVLKSMQKSSENNAPLRNVHVLNVGIMDIVGKIFFIVQKKGGV